MADLPEREEWTPGIYQIETSDPVLGGPDGVDNRPAKDLANRTRWLKGQFEKLINGVVAAGKATQLATARAFKVTGAASGSVAFDGSADVALNLTLSDSGVAPGYYTLLGVNRQGLVIDGKRPTSLVDLGINDALLLTGGTMHGPVIMSGANSIYVQPRVGESWAGGFLTASADLARIQGGIGFSGQGETLQNIYLGLGASPWNAGPGIRITSAGVVVEGPINGVGSGLTGVPWTSLINVPKTLPGLGVLFATQPEAEIGVESSKPMSALRVSQAIAAKVVQATESALGIAAVASQTDLNAGTNDSRFVTAKKLTAWLSTKLIQASYTAAGIVSFANADELINSNLETKVLSPAVVKYGFAMLNARNGYIAFPSWLGGFIIQWGSATIPATTTDVAYPLTYPNAEFVTLANASNATVGLDGVEINYAETGFFRATIVSANGAANQVPGTFKFVSFGR
ncbi:gp53-like domain-containing protein [Pseudomonas rubra]|uniref:Putative tail fiber protein gp53-like C-terminal domain-containing protein n=1 Tax=Pseudomonas rubra TaxID=2942627 RepID=A0ABT5PES8_9PSED|nr:hypothetical protein [Pseudomonas rubra]MDD1016824.1 hypothetical protein [Pseudomonas rubra]MDD1041463.1 hypothetical protein [Pseudomonas rubra]MDD1154968.1 hypothetical protein [Pseudomonas rubra]